LHASDGDKTVDHYYFVLMVFAGHYLLMEPAMQWEDKSLSSFSYDEKLAYSKLNVNCFLPLH